MSGEPRHAASSRDAPEVREDERRSKRQRMKFATFEQALFSKVTLSEKPFGAMFGREGTQSSGRRKHCIGKTFGADDNGVGSF